MIRLFLVFTAVYMAFFFGIHWLKTLNADEGWNLVKSVLYSLVCTFLTISVLIFIVVTF